MDTILSLTTPPGIEYARILTTAAETLARARGMAKREEMRFQLTVEEFFTYLSQVVHEDSPIQTVLTGKSYQACASIRFQASGLCLGALNAGCAVTTSGDAESSRALGLILAGRVADRFRIDRESGDVFILQAEVDKVYPPAETLAQTLTFRPPYQAGVETDPDLLQLAAALAASRYPAWHCPASFQTPGKFADMAGAGRFSCILAMDAQSRPAGLLCWSKSGEQGLAFSGPFVFVPPGDAPLVANLLTDTFLATVARENVAIVFSERATPDAPAGYFESLGSLTLRGPQGTNEQPVLYRHLREDTGGTVWAAPALEEFLHGAYARLAMCRDILRAHPPAAFERRRSLFSTTLDKNKGVAVLRPLLDGEDAAANLTGLVRVLADKGVPNILLYMDLSRAWEAAMAGPALDAGFKPRLVLPCAGRCDVAVLQHESAD